MTKVLSQQKYFVWTNITLSQQKFCCSKYNFVTAKDVFCRDKRVCEDVLEDVLSRQIFAVTKVSSQQT